MSDQKPPVRDTSGRFVRVEEPENKGDDTVHPMARVLFGWTEMRGMGTVIFFGLLALSVALIILDLAIDRHEYIGFTDATGFFGFWGFGAFALAVLSGWPLGRLLRRDEDFYGEADTRPADTDEDAS